MESNSSGGEKEITISLGKVYVYAFYLLIPMIIFFFLPYFLIWQEQVLNFFSSLFKKISKDWASFFIYYSILRKLVLVSIYIITGVVLHELLHALVWVIYVRKGFKIIKFGITPADFSPYVHCYEPLPVWIYRFGTLLPAIVLGLIPLTVSVVIGNGMLFFLGFFFTWAASGDIIVYWLMRKLPSNAIVKDHPDKVGCIVLSGM